MSITWRRALASTTIALVASLGVTACTATNTAPATEQSAPAEQTTPTPKAEEALTADNFVQRLSDAQLKAGTAHFTQTMQSPDSGKIEFSGAMQVGEEPSQARMRMQGDFAGLSMELRSVESIVYIKVGPMTQNKFAKLDADSSFQNITVGSDLGAQLKFFNQALIDFEQNGSETIDGVETKRFVLILDAKKVIAASSQNISADDAELMGETIEYEIFVGADDLPRKMNMEVASAPMQMTFSKWGEPVDIQAPPADQITDQKLPF